MQQTPLEFDRSEGTSLVWNNGSRYKINNVFVSEGTWPKGSTCAKPIQPPLPSWILRAVWRLCCVFVLATAHAAGAGFCAEYEHGIWIRLAAVCFGACFPTTCVSVF